MLKTGYRFLLPLSLMGAVSLWAEGAMSQVSQQQITIAAVMVQFQDDTTSGTAGDGEFVLDPDYGVVCPDFAMDPPPHDRDYFWDHLRAENLYWDRVSQHAVDIDLGASYLAPTVYTLPHEMSYYHPFDQAFDLTEKLSEFIRDVVAEVGSDVDFSAFNTVVIFHAGLGGDFDFALDPTPGNLPSAYLTQSEMSAAGYNLPVPNALIIPESQNMLHFSETRKLFTDSDDPCFYQFGLNGTLALMMGFRLGLPPAYNTVTGKSLIGKFGLMDQGAANMQGIAPAWPNPYSRMLQGWVTPEPIYVGDTVRVRFDQPPLQFTISPGESFLIENRERNLVSTPAGFTQWIVNADTAGVMIAPSGVVLSTDDADAGYPGSGLLIWHVDESAIYTAENPNAGPTQWIDLVEGDGAQDLGYTTRIFFGDFLEQGWWYDPWFAGNEGWFDLNRQQLMTPDSLVRFGPDTHPGTRSNTGRPSHLAINRISRPGTIMSFMVNSDRLVGNRMIERMIGRVSASETALIGTERGTDSLAIFILNSSGDAIKHSDLHIARESLFTGATDTTLKFLYPYFVTHTPAGNRFFDIRNGSQMNDHAPFNVERLSYTGAMVYYWGNTADSGYVNRIDTSTNVIRSHTVLNDSILGLFAYSEVFTPDSLYSAEHDYPNDNLSIDAHAFEPVFFMTSNGGSLLNWGYLFASPAGKLSYWTEARTPVELSVAIPRFAIPIHLNTEHIPEFLLIYDNEISVINAQGVAFPNSPWSVDAWIGNPLVGWFTGSDNPEIFLRHTDGYSIFDIKGKLTDSGSLPAPNPEFEASFCVSANSEWQIISGNQTLLKFQVMDSVRAPLWSEENGGGIGFRTVLSGLPEMSASATVMDLATVFNYPNPVRGNSTKFRAHLGQTKNWKVDIFTLSGAQIIQLNSTRVDVDTFNEIIWDTSKIGNGVYLARVEAAGLDGSTASKIVKVMVIR